MSDANHGNVGADPSRASGQALRVWPRSNPIMLEIIDAYSLGWLDDDD